MTEPKVTVKQGSLRGTTAEAVNGDTFFKFLGIPYAKPPVGDLRFKAPQPAEPWTGERDATKEGSPCFNLDPIKKGLEGSEDCLFLNVFTKELPNGKSSPKPVMVWIHGGGFTMGSSSSDMYGADMLMTEDIVLVTINYRIGILGFLSIDDPELDVPGNAGLKDQVMALRWVKDNIASFGGDPKNITIFGESAGGASVHLLVLSPTAKGLFHRAICMSGVALNPWCWAVKNCQNYVQAIGKKASNDKEALDILRSLTGEEIHKAQMALNENLCDASKKRLIGPVIEKPNPTAFITRDPRDIMLSGEYNDVPLMFGFTNKEGLLLEAMKMLLLEMNPSLWQGIKLEHAVPWFLRNSNPNHAMEKIKEKYLKDGDDEMYDILTDVMFLFGILESVECHRKSACNPIYFYRVSVESNMGFLKTFAKIDKPGVCHADELAYLFKSIMTKISETPKGSLEEKTINRFLKMWTNFAKYGNPTPCKEELGVKWVPVKDVGNVSYLDIGEELKMKVNPYPERMAFWKELSSFGA